MQLSIVKSEQFGNVQCDFWRNENGDVFMTTEQLGTALGYSQPKAAISKLIERNAYLADAEFSGVTKLTTPHGGTQETRIFTEDGIYEVTMLSKTKVAREFRGWVRKVLKSLRRGDVIPGIDTSHEKLTKLMQMLREAERDQLFSPRLDRVFREEVAQLVLGEAREELLPTEIDVNYIYTTADIAAVTGLSVRMIALLSSRYGLRRPEYSTYKPLRGSKLIKQIHYNDAGRAKLIALARKHRRTSA